MTTNQEISLNMFLTVRNTADANESTTKELPGFREYYSRLLDRISLIQAIAEVQRIDHTGLAIAKNRQKETLITMAADYSRKLTALAKFTDNTLLLSEVAFSESDFKRMTDVALKDYLQILYTRAGENIEALAAYGITPESQKNLSDQISSYNSILSTPRTGIAEKSKATKKLKVLFEEANEAIRNMDLAVGIIKLTQPDFFNLYTASRRLVETSSGKIALKARARELESGAPLKGVLFTFVPNGTRLNGPGTEREFSKKTSEKGSFYVMRMNAGSYKVSVSKPGYKNLEITVNISGNERNELSVELEKLSNP